MSVLVKGMKMPRDCYECKVWFECFDEKPPFNMIKSVCPLVEVKEPHGRLIDADAVNKAMDERVEKLKDDRSIYEASCVSTALDMFAPTVIGAERSEE